MISLDNLPQACTLIIYIPDSVLAHTIAYEFKGSTFEKFSLTAPSQVGARIYFLNLFSSHPEYSWVNCAKRSEKTLRTVQTFTDVEIIRDDFVSSIKMLLMWFSAFERRSGGVDEQMKSVELHSISCVYALELNQHETKHTAR